MTLQILPWNHRRIFWGWQWRPSRIGRPREICFTFDFFWSLKCIYTGRNIYFHMRMYIKSISLTRVKINWFQRTRKVSEVSRSIAGSFALNLESYRKWCQQIWQNWPNLCQLSAQASLWSKNLLKRPVKIYGTVVSIWSNPPTFPPLQPIPDWVWLSSRPLMLMSFMTASLDDNEGIHSLQFLPQSAWQPIKEAISFAHENGILLNHM